MLVRRLFQPSTLHWAWRTTALNHPLGRHQGGLRWTHSGGRSYRAVIFDTGGVLMPSPGTVAVGWEVQNHVPSGTIVKAFIRGGDSGPWIRFIKGEITAEHFLEEFGRLCSEIAKTSVPVSSYFSLLTSEQVTKQFPVMTQAISQIRAKGLQTAVLTNNFHLSSGESFLPLDRKQFDVVVESCLEGICKPDPRIFQLCLQRLSLQPSEAIFLDDLGSNLKVAASLGIHTIKVDRPETAVKELEARLGFPLHLGVPNTRPVRKTMAIPQDALEKYLKGLLGSHSTGPMELLQFDHGQSNPTYYIRLADRQLVLRKKPSGTLLPSAHAIEREFRIMKALANTGVPVPTVLDLCEDSSIIGTHFYLMEYCPGIIYKDPSLPGLEPSRREAIYTAMNQVLCRIHSVDLQATSLDSFGKQGDYIPRQVQTWTKQYRAAETSSIPAMERLIQWLPLHLPRQQRTTLVHGDFSVHKRDQEHEQAGDSQQRSNGLSAVGKPMTQLAKLPLEVTLATTARSICRYMAEGVYLDGGRSLTLLELNTTAIKAGKGSPPQPSILLQYSLSLQRGQHAGACSA